MRDNELRTALTELTCGLINIPSVTSDQSGCEYALAHVKELLGEFTCEEFVQNGVYSHLYYVGQKRPERFRVILNIHLDVVPGDDSQFDARVVKGRIYGRGAQDMKSGAAAYIFAFKECAKNVKFPIALQVVTDEEIGGFNGVKVQLEKGVLADFILSGESTNLEINNHAKAPVWIRLSTEGVSAHGAYLWRGDNAIDTLMGILNDLRERYPQPKEEVWQTTLNIARVETSNTAQNKVPDDAVAILDFRVIPEDRDAFSSSIEKLVDGRGTMTYIADEACQITSADHPDVAILADVIRNQSQRDAVFQKTHGGSDVRFYSKLGIGAVCFGPTGAGLHTKEEYVEIESILACYKILSEFLAALK